MLRYWILFCVVALFGLSACQRETKSYQYYMTHPETIKAAYGQCMAMSEADRSVHEECVVALRAEKDFTVLFQSFANNQHIFGMKILKAEEALATATEALATLRKEKAEPSAIEAAQEKQAEQQDTLAYLLAVIRLAGDNG